MVKRRKTLNTRRLAKRNRPWLKRAFRVILSLAIIAVAFFFAKWFMVKASKPYLISYTESVELKKINEEIEQTKAENQSLKDKIEYLSTPQGKEIEARRLGWVKRGEVALVIEQPQSYFVDDEDFDDNSIFQKIGRAMLRIFVKPG